MQMTNGSPQIWCPKMHTTCDSMDTGCQKTTGTTRTAEPAELDYRKVARNPDKKQKACCMFDASYHHDATTTTIPQLMDVIKRRPWPVTMKSKAKTESKNHHMSTSGRALSDPLAWHGKTQFQYATAMKPRQPNPTNRLHNVPPNSASNLQQLGTQSVLKMADREQKSNQTEPRQKAEPQISHASESICVFGCHANRMSMRKHQMSSTTLVSVEPWQEYGMNLNACSEQCSKRDQRTHLRS